jgi:hypothetical protein
MKESGIHRKYKDYKLKHRRSPPPVTIDVDAFPDYQKKNAIKKHTENYGIDNIEKSINITDHVVIYNEDYKGFAYGILSQLNPKLWRGTKLEEKINDTTYFSIDSRLQGYVTEMLGVVSKIHEYMPKQNNKYIIWEKLLHIVTDYRKKVLIIFHTSNIIFEE